MANDPADDRSTKAKIRDAAIEVMAEHGFAATTARKVASEADVSTGLVIHHFGSMDGLRRACDEYIADVIRAEKSDVMAAGPNLDLVATLRSQHHGHLLRYLARVLVDESESVDKLVDDLIADAQEYLREGEVSGMLRPTSDARTRAVLLSIWSLGALAMHRHVERLLGVDLVGDDLADDPNGLAYIAAVFELLGRGIFTEEFTQNITDSIGTGVPPPDGSAKADTETRE